MGDGNRRPLFSRKFFKTFHFSIKIAMSKKTQESGQFDGIFHFPFFHIRYSANYERCTGLSFEMRFESGQFCGLKFGNIFGCQVAAERLQKRCHRSKSQRNGNGSGMYFKLVFQVKNGMNTGNGKSGCRECCNGHVVCLRKPGFVEHCFYRIDVYCLPVYPVKTSGCIHPAVRSHNKNAR